MSEAAAFWEADAAPREAARAQARLVEYMSGHFVAFAPHATMEVTEDLKVVEIPGTPAYAHGLLAWRDQWIPLLDFANVMHAGSGDAPERVLPERALILAYRTHPDAPTQYGAIGLPRRPLNIWVSDSDACALPEDNELWPLFALACFSHNSHPVPIVDAAQLFSLNAEG